MFRKTRFSFGAGLLLALVACTQEAPSFSTKSKDSPAGSFGGNADAKGGTTVATDLAACATASAAAVSRPVSLVFMFDKSGSMLDDGKWTAAVAAAKAFFESTQSAGVSASLGFFPDGALLGLLTSCDASFYATPRVPLTNLPSPHFGHALDVAFPAGSTPTHPALQGALSYAERLQQGIAKDDRVAVVLVTDGLPAGCDGDDVGAVSTLASSMAKSIPTYVIGVGDALGNLDQIAAAGATKQAIHIATNNPTELQQAFSKAIEKIKQASLACDYRIPTAPSGETFDRNRVNVQHTPSGGAPKTIEYNASCGGGVGWSYDDPKAPTRVLLCDTTCGEIVGVSGKIDVLFGCETRSVPVK